MILIVNKFDFILDRSEASGASYDLRYLGVVTLNITGDLCPLKGAVCGARPETGGRFAASLLRDGQSVQAELARSTGFDPREPAGARAAAEPAARLLHTVKVVNLFATVRDKQGKVVTDLTQNDFLLDEDGTPQTIRYSSRETGLPLTLPLPWQAPQASRWRIFTSVS